MVKLVQPDASAAYKVARDVTTAQEAADLGLVVVELNHSTNPPTPIWGKYITKSGAALEITRSKAGDTEVVPASSAGALTPASTGDKGALLNPDDPVRHGLGETNIHEDGAVADPVTEASAQEEIVSENAYDVAQDNTLKTGKKK